MSEAPEVQVLGALKDHEALGTAIQMLHGDGIGIGPPPGFRPGHVAGSARYGPSHV